MGALNVIARKRMRNFIKKYDSYARLRLSTDLTYFVWKPKSNCILYAKKLDM